jgi:pimeloyl-ACP methyl ester carboxylesterase
VKRIITLLNICILFGCFGQDKVNVYCFPGQGSDGRIFDSLVFDPSLRKIIIEYGTPEKDMTMKSFAKKLSVQIDTTKTFILLGVSLGGMICAELSEITNPVKTIIISSAKNRNELPFRYSFQKKLPLYKIFSGRMLLAGAKILQPMVEPDRKKNKATFKQMLGNKNELYMKRTIELLINWDRASNSKKIYHIQGRNDHTLPLRNIQSPDYVIQNGSHMMTLTRAREISDILNSILRK